MSRTLDLIRDRDGGEEHVRWELPRRFQESTAGIVSLLHERQGRNEPGYWLYDLFGALMKRLYPKSPSAWDYRERHRPGPFDGETTAVAALVREDMVAIAHWGDSRAYLIREGEDCEHSSCGYWHTMDRGCLNREGVYHWLLDDGRTVQTEGQRPAGSVGLLSYNPDWVDDRMIDHDRRHGYQYIGESLIVRPDVSVFDPLQPDEAVLLCTDGVLKMPVMQRDRLAALATADNLDDELKNLFVKEHKHRLLHGKFVDDSTAVCIRPRR